MKAAYVRNFRSATRPAIEHCLGDSVRLALQCPACRSVLHEVPPSLKCACGMLFPVVNGVPILLDPSSTVIDVEACRTAFAGFRRLARPGWRDRLRKCLPDISANTASRSNYRRLRAELFQRKAAPVVLVIGGAELGSGLEELARDTRIEMVETDVRPGARVSLACDAQTLPFADATFDGVVIQAVLHLLPDPARCAAEIRRVLRPQGLLYSEAPFLQPAHGGRYDFNRFTMLGHRRLFRGFETIAAGACNGPGTTLAMAGRYFLLSYARRRWTRDAIKLLTLCTLFWLKYFDYLAPRAGSLDAASGTYFFGRKRYSAVSDTEVVNQYAGAVQL
jgi:SAM-dependent methyltransferase